MSEIVISTLISLNYYSFFLRSFRTLPSIARPMLSGLVCVSCKPKNKIESFNFSSQMKRPILMGQLQFNLPRPPYKFLQSRKGLIDWLGYNGKHTGSIMQISIFLSQSEATQVSWRKSCDLLKIMNALQDSFHDWNFVWYALCQVVIQAGFYVYSSDLYARSGIDLKSWFL